MNSTNTSAAKPSEWCQAQYDKALDEGRSDDAAAYLSLYELWTSRNL